MDRLYFSYRFDAGPFEAIVFWYLDELVRIWRQVFALAPIQ